MDIRVIMYRAKNIPADEPTISISFSRREKNFYLRKKNINLGVYPLIFILSYYSLFFDAPQWISVQFRFRSSTFLHKSRCEKESCIFFQSPCDNRPFTRFLKSKIGFSLNFRQTSSLTLPPPSTSSLSVPTEPHRSTGVPVRRAADKKRTVLLRNRPSISAHARVRVPTRFKFGRRVLPDGRAPRPEPRRERRGSRGRSRRSRP